MLAEFIAFVNEEKWDLDSIQIAEVLWFVQQVSPLVLATDGTGEIGEAIEAEDLQEARGKQVVTFALSLLIQSRLDQLAFLLLPDKLENKKVSLSSEYPLTIPPSNKEASNTSSESTAFPTETEKLPIKLPDTGILRNTLALSRLLKPLKKKINSRIAQELDIRETVRRSAELSTPQFPRYFPVLTPKKEHWLDVALLIEDSDSMILWRSLLKEVQDFLEHLGAFRDIKTYRMKWNDDSQNLQIYSFHSGSNSLSPQQLTVSDGRRLILILSDCISTAWLSDKFIEILREWSSKGLLTLLNPFPSRMWERTNLDYTIRIRLGNEKKGLPSQKWEATPLESWQVKGADKQTLVTLPIVSLEPESMGSWVNVMIGKGTSWCSGVWLGSKFMYPSGEVEDQSEDRLTTAQRINYFYATSSQLAWELIQWLSAIPITLSTIRLVQRTLLPESTQVNVAEVVMGGLLNPVKPFNSYQSPNQIQFEFKPGIREAFLEALGKKEFCLGVIANLAEKIASHFGYETVREFEAMLLDEPLKFKDNEDIELIQTFATISVSTLRQYGGEYDTYIRTLDKSRARLNLVSAVEGDSGSLNWIDFLEDIAQQHQLTDSQTEILINLLPTPQQSCSPREVAKYLLISPSALSSQLTNIYRKFEKRNPDLFQAKRYHKLKTLQLYLYSEYVKSPSPELETFELFDKVVLVNFGIVTVNRRGEIIEYRPRIIQQQYYTEYLTLNPSPGRRRRGRREVITLGMVPIPGGTFTMGSPENERGSSPSERPQHNVTVPPFFMGQYPITQAQWKAIASRTDLKVERHLKLDPSYFKKPYKGIDRWQRPVEQVGWYEAVEFCQRLSKLTGRNYRLPSEAEWEYACRSVISEQLSVNSEEANQNPSYPPFYFGETITGELANYNAKYTFADEPKGKYRQQTTPVGQFRPNAFGLYDMHGNVWEWCADTWHENYVGAPNDGSAWEEGKNNNDYHLLRGGSWYDDPQNCRSANRLRNRRDYGSPLRGRGFRVVCDSGKTL